MKITFLALLVMLPGCVHKLPVCQPDAEGADKWSKPCRSASEANSETGEIKDLPDPSDLSEDE